MSLDYPFYEELCRRKHPAAKWWRWGDHLYYLGLVPAVILIFPVLIALTPLPANVVDRFPHSNTWILSVFGFFVVIFLLGAWLKGKAYRMAMRDGINANDF